MAILFEGQSGNESPIQNRGRQFVGVIGPSGCGKSTFMQLLTAIYTPSEGKICLTDGNCRVNGTSIRKYVSYVPQDHLLISGTVAENFPSARPSVLLSQGQFIRMRRS